MKTVLITGGAGFLGSELVREILDKRPDWVVRVFSRDEYKHFQLNASLNSDQKNRVRFLLGDVRDKDRLIRACEGVHIVLHVAALKQIESGEYNPQEVIKTNIDGTDNVIEACLVNNVEQAVFMSSDKAVNPSNLYGATKYVGEKLWLNANHIKGNRRTSFWGFRCGNMWGSSGSVEELFDKCLAEGKPLPITDMKMSRFEISVQDVARLIVSQLGDFPLLPVILVPKMGVWKMEEYIKNQYSGVEYQIIGRRSGEKLYEELVGENELSDEMGDFWIVGRGEYGRSVRSDR